MILHKIDISISVVAPYTRKEGENGLWWKINGAWCFKAVACFYNVFSFKTSQWSSKIFQWSDEPDKVNINYNVLFLFFW